MMPGMDGFAFLETMRADPELNKVLAIVTTAKSLDVDERNRLEHLADELLSKNAYAMRELVELVARRLHERLAQRRAMDSTNPNLAVPDLRRG